MDANNPNKEFRTTPEYAEYQRDNFWAEHEGKVPPFNTRTCGRRKEADGGDSRTMT